MIRLPNQHAPESPMTIPDALGLARDLPIFVRWRVSIDDPFAAFGVHWGQLPMIVANEKRPES